MAIQVGGTTVIDDSRNLVNIASGGGWELTTDQATTQDQTYFYIQVPSDCELGFFEIELSFTTESGNYRAFCQPKYSIGYNLFCAGRTWTNSTTSTYLDNNTQYGIAMNYWNIGNANSTTFSTNERYFISGFVHPKATSTSPFKRPRIVASTHYQDSSGNLIIVNWNIDAKGDNLGNAQNIDRMYFYPQSGSFDARRSRFWKVA
jgi:hypothetical protein